MNQSWEEMYRETKDLWSSGGLEIISGMTVEEWTFWRKLQIQETHVQVKSCWKDRRKSKMSHVCKIIIGWNYVYKVFICCLLILLSWNWPIFEDNVQGNLSVGMHYVLSIIFLLLSIDRFGRWGHRQDSAEVSNGSLRHAGIIIHFTRLHMTSWRPCWWSKRKGFLSHGN